MIMTDRKYVKKKTVQFVINTLIVEKLFPDWWTKTVYRYIQA